MLFMEKGALDAEVSSGVKIFPFVALQPVEKPGVAADEVDEAVDDLMLTLLVGVVGLEVELGRDGGGELLPVSGPLSPPSIRAYLFFCPANPPPTPPPTAAATTTINTTRKIQKFLGFSPRIFRLTGILFSCLGGAADAIGGMGNTSGASWYCAA